MKDQIKPSGYPTDEELKAKLKANNKEIDRLTTVIASTENDAVTISKAIENKKNADGPYSVAQLTIFDNAIKAAIAPLMAEIKVLRNEINALKSKAKKAVAPKVLKEPAKIIENPKTMAEILAETDVSVNAVRNIKIPGTADEI